eukprot:TRINITY_DN2950_c0_g2_i1.p1 TRINITY_DN2950_c0_g2~~TRINITY_DN2950_c0_g2_i1.p1  ORF type:complete len:1142 (+),score=345.94 TRINITY_DN2950_c0_g2_i1:117-3428(+)
MGRRQLRVPAKLVMALGSVVSTAVSFGGGYFLYVQGLAQLQDTVAELSGADTLVSASAIREAFRECLSYAQNYAVLFSRWSPGSLEKLQQYLVVDTFSLTGSSASLWSIGIAFYPQIPAENPWVNSSALISWAWWDPLTDPEYIAKNNGSIKQWITGYYIPTFYGHPSCAPAEGEYTPNSKFCIAAYALNPHTGAELHNVYNWSDGAVNYVGPGGRYAHLLTDWRTRGADFWRDVQVWQSEDGTPLSYMVHISVLPHNPSVPLYREMKLVVMVYISTYFWQRELQELSTDALVVVTTLNLGMGSRVLAINSREPLMRPGCSRDDAAASVSGRCIKTLGDMVPTVQDAARHLNGTTPDTFQRESLSHGEHWLRYTLIFGSRPGLDELPDIWLLWILSTGDIQDAAERSLITFILFIVGVALFDIVLLFVEVHKIGNPMRSMLVSIDHMDGMDLGAARRTLAKVDSGAWVVTEISAVARALHSAILSLQEYKEFLPGSCFADDSGSEPQLPVVPPPEQGDVCIAFTDIQSSTVLWEWAPQVMREALHLHNRTIRVTAADHNGYEVKVIGDAFMLAFPTAVDGVAFALEAQRALLHADWPPELLQCELCCRQLAAEGEPLWCGLRVRIGLNYGAVLAEANPVTRRQDYFGHTVNVAARVEAAVRHGGLVGATEAVITACGAEGLRELGSPKIFPLPHIQLKGVSEPVAVSVLLPTALSARKQQCDAGVESGQDPRHLLEDILPRPLSPGNVAVASPRSRRGPSTVGADLLCTISQGSSSGSGMPTPRTSCSSVSGVSAAGASMAASKALRSSRSTRLGLRITLTQCSIVCVRCALLDASPVDARLPQLLQQVEHNADIMRGSLLCVCSSFAVVTWNVVTPGACVDHRAQAFHFVSALSSARFQRKQTCSVPRHLGAAAGYALGGNIQGRRRHNVAIGGCVEFATLLAAEAEQDCSSALITSAVADYGAATGSVTKAQVWTAAGLPDTGLTVWEFLASPGDLQDSFSAVLGASRWGKILPQTSAAFDDLVPPEVFLGAAKGDQEAADRLRAAAEQAAGDDRLDALLDRLERGALCVRTAPPSAFFLDSSVERLPSVRSISHRRSAFL